MERFLCVLKHSIAFEAGCYNAGSEVHAISQSECLHLVPNSTCSYLKGVILTIYWDWDKARFNIIGFTVLDIGR